MRQGEGQEKTVKSKIGAYILSNIAERVDGERQENQSNDTPQKPIDTELMTPAQVFESGLKQQKKKKFDSGERINATFSDEEDLIDGENDSPGDRKNMNKRQSNIGAALIPIQKQDYFDKMA
jgi:hypothetical protein